MSNEKKATYNRLPGGGFIKLPALTPARAKRNFDRAEREGMRRMNTTTRGKK